MRKFLGRVRPFVFLLATVVAGCSGPAGPEEIDGLIIDGFQQTLIVGEFQGASVRDTLGKVGEGGSFNNTVVHPVLFQAVTISNPEIAWVGQGAYFAVDPLRLNLVLLPRKPGRATITVFLTDGRTAEKEIVVVDQLAERPKEFVEALFFGNGPLRTTPDLNECPGNQDRWVAYPRGTTVEIQISERIRRSREERFDPFAFVRDVVQRIPELTSGWLEVELQLSENAVPRVTKNGIIATAVADGEVGVEGCPDDGACFIQAFADPPVDTMLESFQLLEKEFNFLPREVVRDVVGRGLLGLCRIDVTSVNSNDFFFDTILMSDRDRFLWPRLGGWEEIAIAAVYRSGLQPGATREDFLEAGLIR